MYEHTRRNSFLYCTVSANLHANSQAIDVATSVIRKGGCRFTSRSTTAKVWHIAGDKVGDADHRGAADRIQQIVVCRHLHISESGRGPIDRHRPDCQA